MFRYKPFNELISIVNPNTFETLYKIDPERRWALKQIQESNCKFPATQHELIKHILSTGVMTAGDVDDINDIIRKYNKWKNEKKGV